MRALDAERVAVRKAFGLTGPHCEFPEEVGQVFTEAFGYNGIEAGRKIKGPKKLSERYLTEDVPLGLVFYSSLGSLAGIPTPVTDSVINLVGALLGDDLWSTGRSLDSLGLAEISKNAFSDMLGESKLKEIQLPPFSCIRSHVCFLL
jgi:opine dehydrogenase